MKHISKCLHQLRRPASTWSWTSPRSSLPSSERPRERKSQDPRYCYKCSIIVDLSTSTTTNYFQCCVVLVKRIFPLTNDWAPANKTLCSFLTTLSWCLTLIKLYKTFHPQAVAKMRPVSGCGEEVTREWQELWQRVWHDLSRGLNSYWCNRETRCCFLVCPDIFYHLFNGLQSGSKASKLTGKKLSDTFVTLTSDQNQETWTLGEAASPVSRRQEDRTNIGTLT